MDYFVTLIKIAAVAYMAAILFLYFIQPGLIYYPNLPSRELQSTPQNIGLSFEDVTLTTTDNVSIHAWYIPAGDQDPVLLFFHGNAGNISHRLDSIHSFHKLGFSVFIIDYRGYGNSTGKPSEKGIYRDADAAIKYLTEQRSIALHKITVFGRSLGGAVAAYVASKHAIAALILESTFTSAPDMASRVVPWPIFPLRLISRYSYNTSRRITQVSCPVLVIHSREDEIIPYSHGEKLYAEANEPKQFLKIHGGHNDGFLLSQELYLQGLQKFFSTYKTTNVD